MPKDFMCSRITDNSPIRFLDCNVSELINLYRPKIPYVLQTLFDEGRWRTRKSRSHMDKNGYVRNPNNYSYDACWEGSWKDFVNSNKLYELLNAFYKYGGNYQNEDIRAIAEGIACPLPKVSIFIGNREIEVEMNTPIKMGMKGGGTQNYSSDIVRARKSQLEEKLQTSNRYNHLLMSGGGAAIFAGQIRHLPKTNLQKLRSFKILSSRKKDKTFISDSTLKKWERRHIKEQEKECAWEVSGVNWDVPPLSPNVYQTKAEIVEYVKRCYCFDDIKIKKLTKKYTAKQLVKMYWKDIIDCF